MRLLIVEDDNRFAQTLLEVLKEQNYVVERAASQVEAHLFLENQDYDLLILDVGLPDGDGRDFCQALRQKGFRRPILCLTARDTSDDRVRGLDAGADDYLPKPVQWRELFAKIRALLRRSGHEVPEDFVTELRCGELRLDLQTRKTYYGDHPLALTPTQTLLLECFLNRPRQVMSWQTLADRIYGFNSEPKAADTVRSHLRSLRQQLKTVGLEKLIVTDYGVGYHLDGEAVRLMGGVLESKTEHLQTELERAWQRYQASVGDDLTRLAAFHQQLAACGEQLPQMQQLAHDLKGLLGSVLPPAAATAATGAAVELEQVLKQPDLLFRLLDLEHQLGRLRTAVAESSPNAPPQTPPDEPDEG